MTLERALGSLFVLAAGLLLAALLLSATGVPLPRWPVLTADSSLPRVPPESSFDWQNKGFLWGLATGWLLHWFYGIPWRVLPQTIAGWLRGWRRGVTMLCLAAGGLAVLLLY